MLVNSKCVFFIAGLLVDHRGNYGNWVIRNTYHVLVFWERQRFRLLSLSCANLYRSWSYLGHHVGGCTVQSEQNNVTVTSSAVSWARKCCFISNLKLSAWSRRDMITGHGASFCYIPRGLALSLSPRRKCSAEILLRLISKRTSTPESSGVPNRSGNAAVFWLPLSWENRETSRCRVFAPVTGNVERAGLELSSLILVRGWPEHPFVQRLRKQLAAS